MQDLTPLLRYRCCAAAAPIAIRNCRAREIAARFRVLARGLAGAVVDGDRAGRWPVAAACIDGKGGQTNGSPRQEHAMGFIGGSFVVSRYQVRIRIGAMRVLATDSPLRLNRKAERLHDT
jgi:hypothetical protein